MMNRLVMIVESASFIVIAMVVGLVSTPRVADAESVVLEGGMKMDWDAEFKEIKSLISWVVFGLFVVVNSEYVGTEVTRNDTLMELLMLNMAFLGRAIVVIGVLTFILNTARLYITDLEAKKGEE